MAHDRMTAADAVFLRIETEHEPQHVGSLSLFEGGPLRDADGAIRLDELRRHVERRLHRVPRLRQRVREVPLSQGRPVWIDDEQFDIEYHVRLTSLPRPGNRGQLLDLMSRVQAIPLDRDRPLWEMWFVDGLADERVGLMLKTHHALGDGIANVDLALALVDLEPDPPTDDDVRTWYPRAATPRSDLLAEALVEQTTRPWAIGRRALGAVRNPRPAIDGAGNVVRTVRDFLAKPTPAPWNQAVGAQRRWVSATVPLESVREVRGHHDATINDVVLAACTGALRMFLEERDARPDETPLRAMVPVSLRTDDEHGDTLGNRISLILVDLPIGEPDPAARLADVHQQTSRLKGSPMVDGAQTILDLADGIPQIAGPITNFVSRQIPMNLVVTNVPGPPIPLFLRGARLEETYPYVEVIDNEGLTIAVVSYDDQLFFGITGDRDVLADLDELASLIIDEFDVLAATS
ncbi:MAG: wax ester/triacylglycerol synthase family O-acyltransferase [Actinomycetota bacterium]